MKPIEQILTDHFKNSDDVLNFRHAVTSHVIIDRSDRDAMAHIFGDVDWLGVANAVKSKNEPVYDGEPIRLADAYVGDAQSVADAIREMLEPEVTRVPLAPQFTDNLAMFMRLVDGEVMTTHDDERDVFRVVRRAVGEDAVEYLYSCYSKNGLVHTATFETFDLALAFLSFEGLPITFMRLEGLRLPQGVSESVVQWVLHSGKALCFDKAAATEEGKLYMQGDDLMYQYWIHGPRECDALEDVLYIARIGVGEFYVADAPVALDYEIVELPEPFGQVNPSMSRARELIETGLWSLYKDQDEPYAGEQLLYHDGHYLIVRHDCSYGESTVDVTGDYDNFGAAYRFFCMGLPIESAYVVPVCVDENGGL